MITVFALGSNGSGQLGIGHREDVSVPKPVLWADSPPSAIVGMAAGGNHTLLLLGDGRLWWSGDPISGACGLASSHDVESEPKFRKMVLGQDGDSINQLRVQKVAATWDASIFAGLDDYGKCTRLYSCGIGEKGELGQGPLVIRTALPGRIPDFPPTGSEITDLAACMGHVVAVLSNGDAYGWGNGRKGQLGAPEEVVSSPRKIAGVGFAVRRVVCGKDFTCLLGEPTTGEICILGSNKWGIKTSAPSSVHDWSDAEASWNSIFILKSDGTILGWGRNDYSQVSQPDSLKALQIAAGSEHAVALLQTGDALAWGWGEHGNCGPLTGQEKAKGQRNIVASAKYLPPGTNITTIGAGCATSWIIVKTGEP